MSTDLTPTHLTPNVQEILGDLLIASVEKFGQDYYLIDSSNIIAALSALKSEFPLFSECMGVDYSQWQHERDFSSRFEVVYNLLSTTTGRRIFLKTGVEDGASLPTAKHVYQGAEYPEKEIFDMFGIGFDGNELAPGTRFLLPDDWIGHPLRKEYPLGGEDVLFDQQFRGPAVEDKMVPHAGESFEGKTGTDPVSGR